MWVCTQLGNAFGLISYSLLCMCVCMCTRRQCVYTRMRAIMCMALGLCAVLMEHADTLGGLHGIRSFCRRLEGQHEDLASMQ